MNVLLLGSPVTCTFCNDSDDYGWMDARDFRLVSQPSSCIESLKLFAESTRLYSFIVLLESNRVVVVSNHNWKIPWLQHGLTMLRFT